MVRRGTNVDRIHFLQFPLHLNHERAASRWSRKIVFRQEPRRNRPAVPIRTSTKQVWILVRRWYPWKLKSVATEHKTLKLKMPITNDGVDVQEKRKLGKLSLLHYNLKSIVPLDVSLKVSLFKSFLKSICWQQGWRQAFSRQRREVWREQLEGKIKVFREINFLLRHHISPRLPHEQVRTWNQGGQAMTTEEPAKAAASIDSNITLAIRTSQARTVAPVTPGWVLAGCCTQQWHVFAKNQNSLNSTINIPADDKEN